MKSFKLDAYYHNEDFGGTIKVVSLDPFKVHKQGIGTYHEDRQLYREKLNDGTIYLLSETS